MKTTKELIIADITAKVEAKLASQKVDLTLEQDAQKLLASYYTLTDNANSKYTGVASSARALVSKLDEAIKTASEMPKLITRYQQLAKELGIDVNNLEDVKDMNFAIKDVAQFKELRKKMEMFLS